MNKCPQCEVLSYTRHNPPVKCDLCMGVGYIEPMTLLYYVIGQAHQKARLERRETLIGYANRMHLDPEVVSKAERGVIDPTEILK